MSEGKERRPANGLTKEEVGKVAEEAIDSRLQKWKYGVTSFFAGVGIFVILGITWDDFRLFLFDMAYPPHEIYERLKKELREDPEMRTVVAADIVKLIGERVDSGYSRTFYYGPSAQARPDDGLLQFYARDDQKVELTVSAHGVGGFALTVNNRSVVKRLPQPGEDTYDFNLARQDISPYLKEKSPPADELPVIDEGAVLRESRKNIHTLKVTPLQLPKTAESTFEILILVRNENIK